MNLRRITAMIWKDITGGAGRTFFIMAIVVPIIMTLLVDLIFGKLFVEKPTLAVIDKGNSQVVRDLKKEKSIIVKDTEDVKNEEEMKEKVESGAIDGGLILPEDFDLKLEESKIPKVTVYIGGESHASNRMVIASVLADVFRNVAGQELPIKLVEVSLGDEAELPIKIRVIPFLIMYAIMIGGMTLPAALIVDEFQKRTVTAIAITPASLGEFLLGKAIIGFAMSFIMGVVILIINQVFIGDVWLLLLFIVLAAFLAVDFGLIIGEFSKDLNTAWTYVKLIGLLAIVPAMFYWFPQVPEWVYKIFPTYYLMNPIMEISQGGATFSDIWFDALILLAFNFLFIIPVIIGKRRMAEKI